MYQDLIIYLVLYTVYQAIFFNTLYKLIYDTSNAHKLMYMLIRRNSINNSYRILQENGTSM